MGDPADPYSKTSLSDSSHHFLFLMLSIQLLKDIFIEPKLIKKFSDFLHVSLIEILISFLRR